MLFLNESQRNVLEKLLAIEIAKRTNVRPEVWEITATSDQSTIRQLLLIDGAIGNLKFLLEYDELAEAERQAESEGEEKK
jgi:hypothetical protein